MTSAEVCISPSWQQKGRDVAAMSMTLSAQAQAVARAELNEDDNTKEQQLQEFREWVLKNKGLVDIRTDDSFLLRFLRFKKWSVTLAEHTLVKYLNFRQSVPQYLFNLDCDETKVAELLHSGYIYVCPNRDSVGRRIIIGSAALLDLSKYSNVHMAKAHAITYEALLDDQESQIFGFQHIGDLRGQNLSHLSLFNPIEFHMCMRIGEQAFPMRHKGIHFINMNNAFRYAYEFFCTRFSDKMRDRLRVHSTLEELHEYVDRKCLPKELGGDMPMSDMIVSWQKELAQQRLNVLHLDRMKSLIPIQRRNNTNQIEEIRGTFKKLEVD